MILIYLWYCLWIVWFFIFSVYGLCFGPMVFYLLCPLVFYLFCLLDSVYYVFKANLLCVASQCHQWFETGRKRFEPGTIAWRIASLTLFTCSSRSLTFILRSLFLSLSMDSSVVRVGINLLMHLLSGLPAFVVAFVVRVASFCLQFSRHLFDASLFRSLMWRYFWWPEQPGSHVIDDSELMLKLEETWRHLALKINGNLK